MSGKIFVGNLSNIATLPKNILVGDSNNIAKNVKTVYVGNSSNQAVKVWPNSRVPEGYQEVEYITVANIGANSFALTFSESKRVRFVTSFKIHQKRDEEASSYLFYTGSLESVSYGGSSIGNRLKVEYDSNNFYTNVNEGILLSKLYTIDFANLNNGLARFYLYCEDGYYSIPANNLLGTASKITTSSTRPYALIYVGGHYTTSFYISKLYDNSGYSSGDILHEFIPCYEGTRENFSSGFYDIIDRIFYPIVPSYYHSINITLGPDV